MIASVTIWCNLIYVGRLMKSSLFLRVKLKMTDSYTLKKSDCCKNLLSRETILWHFKLFWLILKTHFQLHVSSVWVCQKWFYYLHKQYFLNYKQWEKSNVEVTFLLAWEETILWVVQDFFILFINAEGQHKLTTCSTIRYLHWKSVLKVYYKFYYILQQVQRSCPLEHENHYFK